MAKKRPLPKKAMEAGQQKTLGQSAKLVSKSSLMYFIVLLVWIITIVLLVIHAASTYGLPNSVGLWILMVLVAICLLIFWFYALYHYGLVIFRNFGKVRPKAVMREELDASLPAIALLYCTVDDFRYEAALRCVEQDYPNFHVFLIDVSQSEKGRQQVDEFQRQFSEKTTIVRRAELAGFKARSLNLALANQANGYDFFALCDADGILAKDFLKKAMTYIQQGQHIGFVQANHNSGSSIRNAFSEHFLPETEIRWQYNNVPRNRYGFPLMLGHAVLVLTEAYLKAGKFPEVVAEDVAFTIAMRHAGYTGYFAEDIICSEGVPEDLGQLRKRTYRMTAADTETFATHTVPFIKHPSTSFAEKMDIIAHTLRRTSSSLVLPYLILLIAISFSSANPMVITSWWLVAFGWLLALSPLLRVIVSRYNTPIQLYRHLSQVTVCYLSFCLHVTVSIIAFLIARRAHFIVTGAKAEEKGVTRLGFKQRLARLNPNSRPLLISSIILALAFIVLAIITANIALGGFGLAMLSPLIQDRLNWNNKAAEATAWLALLLMFAGSIMGPLGLIGPAWQYLVPVGISVLVRT